ncbi:unnamed protein product, partial [marine sediment metagenome]
VIVYIFVVNCNIYYGGNSTNFGDLGLYAFG